MVIIAVISLGLCGCAAGFLFGLIIRWIREGRGEEAD
jgi:hypothetical protein